MQKVHLFISSACAIAAVALGAIQTFNLASPPKTAVAHNPPVKPVSQTVSIAKGNGQSSFAGMPDARKFRYSSTLPGDAAPTVDLAAIFDSQTMTTATVNGQNGVDFIVEFGEAGPVTVTGLDYSQPAFKAAAGQPVALDVMVLPEGQVEGGGRAILSFPLSGEEGVQTFRIPATSGKGLWIRLAGTLESSSISLGELRVLTETSQ
jgi:hypothetical protein